MKYLGVDFGIKRVGLARSEGDLASPYKILEGKGVWDLVEKIKNEAKEFDNIVIGVPEGRMGETVKKVVKHLRAEGLAVYEADETLSSKNAVKLMVELGLSRKKRRSNDAIAASEILQNYLDQKNKQSLKF